MNRIQTWMLGKMGVISLLGLGVFFAAGCGKLGAASSGAKKDVVAQVGNETIAMSDVDDKIAKLPPQYQSVIKERKKELVDDMVIEILLLNEAKRKGLQNDKEVKDLLREAEKKIIISKLLKDEIENKVNVTDKETENYFNSNRSEFTVPERWKASHILVKTEDEAKAALDELAKGKSFEDMAKERSIDTTANKGGDVGYFTKGQMVSDFENAAIALEVGKTSGIVKSQIGYHIIKLVDKKAASEQEFKDISERLKNELALKKRREIFDKIITDLKAKTKVTVNESLLAPEKETATAQTTPK